MPTPQEQQDREHLTLLSIFHYVVAGMMALFAMFPIFHLGIGIWMLTSKELQSAKDPPPPFLGWVFVLFPLLFILTGWALASATAYAGRCLSRRRRYYCFVVAAVEAALCMPFGTVLGVFTIIVLVRPGVKVAFGLPAPEA
jgi:hypothetical protein